MESRIKKMKLEGSGSHCSLPNPTRGFRVTSSETDDEVDLVGNAPHDGCLI
jgi:hypothetical protein